MTRWTYSQRRGLRNYWKYCHCRPGSCTRRMALRHSRNFLWRRNIRPQRNRYSWRDRSTFLDWNCQKSLAPQRTFEVIRLCFVFETDNRSIRLSTKKETATSLSLFVFEISFLLLNFYRHYHQVFSPVQVHIRFRIR